MNNSFFKFIILTFIFVSSLFSSNEEVNQKLFELKTSQEYAQKINDEKITLIIGQIISKENEIKKLEKELKEYVNKEDLQKEITYQNNRIDDINSSVDKLSVIVSSSIGLFGVLITAVVIFFAFKFERIAKFKAEEEVKSWIDEKAQKVFNIIVEESKKELEKKAEKELSNIKNETTDKIDEFIDNLNNRSDLKRKEKDYKETFKLVIKNYKDNNIEKAITNIKDAIQLAENEKDKIQSLFAHALLLEQLNKSEEAIKVYDEIVKRFEDSKENSILEKVAWALHNKGVLLTQLCKSEESIIIFDELIKRFENSNNHRILEIVAWTLLRIAVIFEELNKKEEAIMIYDKLIRIFELEKNVNIKLVVGMAYINKGSLLASFNKYEEAIKLYDKIINNYNQEKEIEDIFSSALYNKAKSLLELSLLEDFNKKYLENSISILNKLLFTFRMNNDEIIKLNLLKGFILKAVCLALLNKIDESLTLYDDFIDMYKNFNDEKFNIEIINGLSNKAFLLRKIGKLDTSLNVFNEIIVLYKRMDNLDNPKQIIIALINKIELNLMLNKSNSQEDLNLYFQLVEEDKNELIKYKMLTLLEKAKDSELDNEIEEWKKEFKDISIENWSFIELKDWAISFENQEIKERLLKYIDIFENHNKKLKA